MNVFAPASRRRFLASAALLALASALPLAGCGSDGGTEPAPTRVVEGASRVVNGARIQTWARLRIDNSVEQVGLTVPRSVLVNPPSEPGDGPAGAFASLQFPAEVRTTTFLEHAEIAFAPEGHPPARYQAPHFDLHFYNQTEAEVLAVAPPETVAPTADRIPQGYVYPGIDQAVPQMGVHAINGAEFAPNAPPFAETFILGYWRGEMTFLEPMITQQFFVDKRSYSLNVPKPETLGQVTRYPGRYAATYIPATDSYEFVFSDFAATTK